MTTYAEERTVAQQSLDRRIRVRVARGIELLKEKHGDDWVEKIDMKALRLESGACCVLGQVYGDYELGCNQLDIAAYGSQNADDPKYASHYGFMGGPDEPPGFWGALQRQWELALNSDAE